MRRGVGTFVFVVVTDGVDVKMCSKGYISGTKESEQMPALNSG